MTVRDITPAMAPKSDQLNADDLIAGPRTIRIRDVQIASGEQPVSIFFDGDNDKPWKPSKTAMRCLALIWGADAEKWLGLSCTIYNDETVTWAGVAVGGIRVSHMEGLTKPRVLQITKARGKKVPVTIEPLTVDAPKTKTGQWKDRLFKAAEEGKISVEDAWAKVPADVKKDLGPDVYDQLLAMEDAARKHNAPDMSDRLKAAKKPAEEKPAAEYDDGEVFPGDPAMKEGQEAFMAGLEETDCPHSDNPAMSCWLYGWRNAKKATEE